jgi:hypothetical protein
MKQPQPLTIAEYREFNKLKLDLFCGSSFMIFDDKTLASKKFKRYEELLTKRMKYRKTLVESN